MVLSKVLALFALSVALLFGQSVTQQDYDSNASGANTSEMILTPTSVARGLGLRCKLQGDGQAIYAQPLVAAGVGPSGHDLIVFATLGNHAYAYDGQTCAQVWATSQFDTPRPDPGQATQLLYGSAVGCLSTGVLDIPNNWYFLVCENNTPAWVLRKLNLTTGAVIASQTVSMQVPGTGTTGDTIIGGMLQFTATNQIQREGLVLSGGNIYFAFAAAAEPYAGNIPWHGWMPEYNESLVQQHVFCTTPNGNGGSIWAGTFAVDVSGNLYAITGNGDWDGTANYSMSYLKLSPALALLDFWTPSDWAALSAADIDLGSNRAFLIPGTTYVMSVGKDFKLTVLDTTSMGHLNGTPHQQFTINGTTPTDVTGSYAGMLMNNVYYTPTTNAGFFSFAFNTGTALFNTSPNRTFQQSFPGGIPAGSANGTNSGLVWIVTPAADAEVSAQAGTLRAFDAGSLIEIWNSGLNANDALGNMAKFAIPTISHGQVYVSTQSGWVGVYGAIGGTVTSGVVIK